MNTLINAADVLNDFAASDWLKAGILSALARDPVDAVNDAEVLLAVLRHRMEAALKTSADE